MSFIYKLLYWTYWEDVVSPWRVVLIDLAGFQEWSSDQGWSHLLVWVYLTSAQAYLPCLAATERNTL